MSDNEDKEVFPIVVFLDTNILDSLPENLVAGDLSGLVADAAEIHTKVYIPDVVAREWLKHRIGKFLDSCESYFKNVNHIKKYFSEIPEFQLTREGVLNNVYKSLIGSLKKCGCRLLGPPEATIPSLTRNAVWSRVPFRHANKGFKDELVVLSMLKLKDRGWNYKTYVLVTRDSDFPAEGLKKRFGKHGIKFEKVNSLQEASTLLDEKLDIAWKQERAAREAEVKGFLSQHWQTISEAIVRQVEEKGLDWITLYLFGRSDIPKESNVKRIVNTIPIEVVSVDVGMEDTNSGEIPVTISVRTKLSLEIDKTIWDYHRLLWVGTQEHKFDGVPMHKTEAAIIEIERTLSRNAVIKRTSSGEYTELQLVDVRPDYQTFLEKMEAG